MTRRGGRLPRHVVLMACCRWGPRSGLDVLFPAFAAEFSPSERVGLLVLLEPASDVDVREEIEALDLPRGRAPIVVWVDGALSPDEARDTIAGADAFVALPSGEDATALAASVGLPVVSEVADGKGNHAVRKALRRVVEKTAGAAVGEHVRP